MRRRIVRPNVRSFTGRHLGGVDTATVRYESGLERDFLTLVNFRDDVVEVVEQPVTLAFTDSTGRKRTYTPDFKVVYRTKTAVYEIKYKDKLRADWATYRESMLFARRWAKQNGMFFRIMTDCSIRTVRFLNADMLLPHRPTVPDPEVAASIISALRLGPMTVLRLLKSVCSENSDRAKLYGALWPMLARGQLKGDFDRPLGMEFVVELPE